MEPTLSTRCTHQHHLQMPLKPQWAVGTRGHPSPVLVVEGTWEKGGLWDLTGGAPLSLLCPPLPGLDLLPFCTTFLLCFWEVQYGILAGTLVSLLLLLHAVARPKMQVQ